MKTAVLVLAIVASVAVVVLIIFFFLKNQKEVFALTDELRQRMWDRKQNHGNKKEWRLSKLANVLAMAAVNLIAVWTVQYLVLQFIKPSWFVTLVICVAVIPVVIIMGIVDIPIQHVGVPLVLGKRQKRWLVDEGLGWILPSPLMGVEIVDLREKTIPIPKDETEEKERPLIIPAIRGLKPTATNGTDGAEPEIVNLDESEFSGIRFVQMKARIAIRYSIVHPFRFLNQGPDVVERGLGDLAIKTLRQMGTIMSDIDLIRQKDRFEGKIIEEMKREPADKDIANEGGQSPLERWGVRVHNVFIPRIAHAEPKMAEAYEAAMREEQQKTAEEIEQIFLAESIDRLVAKGLKPQEALYAIQSERGKLMRREIIITSTGGGAAGDIAKAVATYAGLLGEQPKSENSNDQNTQKGGNQ